MPGILLNRLSRPKEGETPHEQLARHRAVLLEQMRPVICPDGIEGTDWIYLEDIASRLSVHEEGGILDRAIKLIRAGRCAWLAATEIPRITGDLETAGLLIKLARDHQIPIYTRERLAYPYEPWRPRSAQELLLAFFLSANEVETYRGRMQDARAAFYPVDPKTGESRLQTMQGLGRHINGKVPRGYVWNKTTKQPEPDTSVPAPEYVAPGQTTPAAFTMFEIVKRLRELGLTLGGPGAVRQLYTETGVAIDPAEAVYIWQNPFYAGRPTSRTQRVGGKMQRRAEPVATIGDYPALDTWEGHQALVAAVRARNGDKRKTTSSAWASGIVRCPCGQPWISWGTRYRCRGALRDSNVAVEASRRRRFPGIPHTDRHRVPEGWIRTPTCGMMVKTAVHAAVEDALRALFARPDLAEAIARWQARQEETSVDRSLLYRQQNEIGAELVRLEARRVNVVDMGERGDIAPGEVSDRLNRIRREKEAHQARLNRVGEALAAPILPPASLALLQRIVQEDFEELWRGGEGEEALTDQERGLIARAFLDHIPVTGAGQYGRRLGTPVYSSLVEGGRE